MGIKNLGYVILEMTDPKAWADFAVDVLGFGIGEVDGEIYYLRMDNHAYRYMVRKGTADRLVSAGYQVDDLDALEAALSARGVDVSRVSEADAATRKVSNAITFTDPSGNVAECFDHMMADARAFTPGHGITEFNTGEMGLGHLVLPAPESDSTIAFYEALGFSCSDDLTLPAFAEGLPDQRIYFMHADNPRHHTLGLYNFPNPTGVIHVMVEVNTIDEVGICMDRVKAAGLHIFASLGRHSNDEMVSFYFFGPGGIGIEVGYEGKQVKDWSQFAPTKSTSGDIWGHEYDFPVVE